MNRINMNFPRISAVFFAAMIASCGGGGGSNGSGEENPTRLKGQFIDSPVAGLHYETESGSGITDNNGYFEYSRNGEIINFYIGNTSFGFATASPSIHVMDIKTQTGSTLDDPGPRLSQLLQTLDSDNDPTNGIQLSSAGKAYLSTQSSIDFSATDVAWDKQLQSIASASGTKVVPLTQAVAHAQSNLPTGQDCSIPDRSSPKIFKELMEFNSSGKSCQKKADILAFSSYTLFKIQSDEQIFRSDLMPTPTTIKNDIDLIVKNNIASQFIKIATDFASFSEKKGDESRKKIFALIASKTAQLLKDFIATGGVVCNYSGSCTNDQIHTIKLITKILDFASNTSSCLANKPDKCANAIKSSFSINNEFGLDYGSMPAKDLEKISSLVSSYISVISDTYEFDAALTGDKKSALIRLGGNLLNTTIKSFTEYHIRSDEETINRSYLVNILEIIGEGVKTSTSCLNFASATCLKSINDYFTSRSAEIGVYVTTMLTASDLEEKADDIKTAAAILHEYLHYNNSEGILTQYGINKDTPDSWRQVIISVSEKIYGENSKQAARYRKYHKDVLENFRQYKSLNDFTAAAILKGQITTCDSISLDEWSSPQIIKQNGIFNAPLNQDILFSANYNPSDAIIGFIVNFGDGQIIDSDLPAATHKYTHGGTYNSTVTPIVRSVKTRSNQICDAQRKSIKIDIRDFSANISGITPVVATLGAVNTFTITGNNLPTSPSMTLGSAPCQIQSSPAPTATGFTAVCTPSGTAGNQVVKIMDSSGTLIDGRRSIAVSDSAKVLAYNDFSSTADLAGWEFTLPWNANKLTTDYELTNGALRLWMKTTDKGGNALSPSFPATTKVKLSVRHLMNGGRWYFPNIGLTNETAVPTNTDLNSINSLYLSFTRSEYSSDNRCSSYDIPQAFIPGECLPLTLSTTKKSSSFYGQWIVSTMVYDSTTGAVEIDLEGDGVVDITGTVPPGKRFMPSRVSFGTAGWWTGHEHLIDWVKVESMVAGDAVPAPVFSVRFDQASLTSLGGVTSSGGVSYISGKDGRPAAKFGGVASPGHIKINNRDALKFADGATFDMWVYMDSLTGMDGWGNTVKDGAYKMALLAKSHDRSGGVMLANSLTNPDSNLFHAGIGNWNLCNHISSAPVPLGTWARVTYVFSSTSGTYGYLNKNLVWNCPSDRPDFAIMNTQDMYIGKFSDSWYPFSGAIQDLNVYSKALSSAQVSALQ